LQRQAGDYVIKLTLKPTARIRMYSARRASYSPGESYHTRFSTMMSRNVFRPFDQ